MVHTDLAPARAGDDEEDEIATSDFGDGQDAIVDVGVLGNRGGLGFAVVVDGTPVSLE
jgi:hypothetical protein